MIDFQVTLDNMTDRERFLYERKSGIGGSDVAAIMGFSKWKSAFEVWQDKLGMSDTDFDNEAMLWGRLLEPVIREHYATVNNCKVFNLTSPLRNPKFPCLVANVDGAIANARKGLEIKTARYMDEWGEFDTDEIPYAYLLQVNHYMMVAEVDEWDVAVLFSGSTYRQYTIRANKELQELIYLACSEFWHNHVLTAIPPPPTSYSDCVKRWGDSGVSGEIIASAQVEDAVKRLALVKNDIKANEATADDLSFIITAAMNDRGNTLVKPDGTIIATWKKPTDSVMVDSNALQKEYPAVYSKVLKDRKSTRRLLVKK